MRSSENADKCAGAAVSQNRLALRFAVQEPLLSTFLHRDRCWFMVKAVPGDLSTARVSEDCVHGFRTLEIWCVRANTSSRVMCSRCEPDGTLWSARHSTNLICCASITHALTIYPLALSKRELFRLGCFGLRLRQRRLYGWTSTPRTCGNNKQGSDC